MRLQPLKPQHTRWFVTHADPTTIAWVKKTKKITLSLIKTIFTNPIVPNSGRMGNSPKVSFSNLSIDSSHARPPRKKAPRRVQGLLCLLFIIHFPSALPDRLVEILEGGGFFIKGEDHFADGFVDVHGPDAPDLA